MLCVSWNGMTVESPMLDNGGTRPGRLRSYQADLSIARFEQGAILQEQEAPVAHVCFPMNGLVSLGSVMEDGREIATAVLGRDGAVGAFGGAGRPNALARATVQIPATCAVITESHFRAAVSRSGRIRDVILRFKEALFGQERTGAFAEPLVLP